MKTHLNLLPIGYLRARLIRRRLALWSPVWLAVALLGASRWWTGYTECRAVADQRMAREQRYEPVKRMMVKVGDMRRRIDELEARETMLDELSEPHPPLSGLALIGLSASKCDGRVRVDHLVLERNKSAAAPAAGRRQAPNVESLSAGRSRVLLDGTGLDNQAIAAFVEALKNTGAFLEVELKSTVRTGDETDAVRTFMVVCEY